MGTLRRHAGALSVVFGGHLADVSSRGEDHRSRASEGVRSSGRGVVRRGQGVLWCTVITFFAVTLSESARQSVLHSRSGYYTALLIQHARPILPDDVRNLLGRYIDELDRRLDPNEPDPPPIRPPISPRTRHSRPSARPTSTRSWNRSAEPWRQSPLWADGLLIFAPSGTIACPLAQRAGAMAYPISTFSALPRFRVRAPCRRRAVGGYRRSAAGSRRRSAGDRCAGARDKRSRAAPVGRDGSGGRPTTVQRGAEWQEARGPGGGGDAVAKTAKRPRRRENAASWPAGRPNIRNIIGRWVGRPQGTRNLQRASVPRDEPGAEGPPRHGAPASDWGPDRPRSRTHPAHFETASIEASAEARPASGVVSAAALVDPTAAPRRRGHHLRGDAHPAESLIARFEQLVDRLADQFPQFAPQVATSAGWPSGGGRGGRRRAALRSPRRSRPAEQVLRGQLQCARRPVGEGRRSARGCRRSPRG